MFLAFGHIGWELLLGRGLAAPTLYLLGIVAVEKLHVLASLIRETEERLTLPQRDGLVAETLTIHVENKERLVAHGAVAVAVRHFGMAYGFNHTADPQGHLKAVAGLANLLGLAMSEVGQVPRNHLGVVLVITSAQNDTLGGVELEVSAVGVLAHDAVHAARFILKKLHGRGLVVKIDALAGQEVSIDLEGLHVVALGRAYPKQSCFLVGPRIGNGLNLAGLVLVLEGILAVSEEIEQVM